MFVRNFLCFVAFSSVICIKHYFRRAKKTQFYRRKLRPRRRISSVVSQAQRCNMGTWHLMGFLTLLIFLTCDGKRDCKVVPLKARPSIKADVIFSGTVKRFLKNPIDQFGRKSKSLIFSLKIQMFH